MDEQTPNSQPIWWIDLTTVMIAFDRPGKRPTGIPRVALELALAAADDMPDGETVRYSAYDFGLPGFREISLDELRDRAGYATSNTPTKSGSILRLGDIARSLARIAPGDTGDHINRFRALQRTLRNTKTKLKQSLPGGSESDPRKTLFQNGGYYHPFSSGDIWINFGCWWHGRCTDALAEIKSGGTDVTSCVLIHDCMPLAYPEFFPLENALDWRNGLDALRASTDLFLGNSDNTCADIREFVLGDMPDPPEVCSMRLGEQFHKETLEPSQIDAVLKSHDIHEPYVLYTSTIEVRKNHTLAFRAWRQMLRERGDGIPLLVFVGSWGWKTKDLKEQLADSADLDGKVRVLNGVPDRELAALYDGALFTIFPSLYEGWGLPVRESQLHGKVCVAANNSAITEAGGDLAIYFESDDRPDFTKAVTQLLDNPDGRTALEARIASEFKELTWAASWSGVRSTIGGALSRS